MPTSVRLDDETERLLTSLAMSRGQTKSEIIRDAIRALSERESDGGAGPAAAAEDLIGSIRGGPSDLSRDTGARLRRLLADDRRSERR